MNLLAWLSRLQLPILIKNDEVCMETYARSDSLYGDRELSIESHLSGGCITPLL